MSEFYKDKKVLVMGGAGFVGTNLIIKLLEAGAKVRATLHIKPAQFEDPAIEYVRGDLTDKAFVRNVVDGMDFVFMCAANTSGAAVMDKTPLAHVTPNVLINTLALDAAYAAGVKKIMFLSSNTVYPLSDKAMKEDDMVFGELYEKYYCVAWMKQFSEILCNMYSSKIKKPMPSIVVRPANLYGPYDDFEWETSHVLPALMRKVIERMDPLEVWGDGNDIKDFLYIDDFIEGIMLAMEKYSGYDPVNIASGVQSTVRQALGYMLEIEGYDDAEVVYNTDKPSMIPFRMLDASKAVQDLGFSAKVSLCDGIARTIEWYRANKG